MIAWVLLVFLYPSTMLPAGYATEAECLAARDEMIHRARVSAVACYERVKR